MMSRPQFLQPRPKCLLIFSDQSLDQILKLTDELVSETVAIREKRACLTSGRADVIVAGLYILAAAMEALGATTLRCRDRGHRFALL